jgi:hypothetical protein
MSNLTATPAEPGGLSLTLGATVSGQGSMSAFVIACVRSLIRCATRPLGAGRYYGASNRTAAESPQRVGWLVNEQFQKLRLLLNAQFAHLRIPREPKKALCAVAASILAPANHLLKRTHFYQDLAPAHFACRRPEANGDR